MINYSELIVLLSAAHIDFAASTLAFMENQGRHIIPDDIENTLPEEMRSLFRERLAHYRDIYRPQS
ncbi:DNA polymerase III subunit theta [Salmonella enterica]|nr:DNA polymerase III subunit theta [Salmonella enterica subsp. enterica serovar Panama]HCM4742672.1 DNA polymerase III subunit theta [Salmonella enterica subsp. enterica serovar Panama]